MLGVCMLFFFFAQNDFFEIHPYWVYQWFFFILDHYPHECSRISLSICLLMNPLVLVYSFWNTNNAHICLFCLSCKRLHILSCSFTQSHILECGFYCRTPVHISFFFSYLVPWSPMKSHIQFVRYAFYCVEVNL